MKKIIVLIPAAGYPDHVVNYAIHIASACDGLLSGYFVEPVHTDRELQYFFPNDLSFTEREVVPEALAEQQNVESNARFFENDCQKAQVPHEIKTRSAVSYRSIVADSAFADLLIADGDYDLGSHTVGQLIRHTHCPALLIGKKTRLPERAVLLYNGALTSVHAIKLYAYLLGDQRQIPTSLIVPEYRDEEDWYALTEWAKLHFPGITLDFRKENLLDTTRQLIGTVDENTIFVTGSTKEKGLAGLFQKDVPSKIIDRSDIAVFATHHL